MKKGFFTALVAGAVVSTGAHAHAAPDTDMAAAIEVKKDLARGDTTLAIVETGSIHNRSRFRTLIRKVENASDKDSLSAAIDSVIKRDPVLASIEIHGVRHPSRLKDFPKVLGMVERADDNYWFFQAQQEQAAGDSSAAKASLRLIRHPSQIEGFSRVQEKIDPSAKRPPALHHGIDFKPTTSG
jgi:hypothetical protein